MTKTENETTFRSGFVALVGRPNVGKSTLMNALVGQKIAIMSHRPQTTRNQIRGVLTTDDAQVVFIDTPGIHKPKHRLGEFMVETAESTLKEVDVVCWVCDVTEPNHSGDAYIIERLKAVETPVVCILNKVDAVEKPGVLVMMDALLKQYPFAEMIPVSAKDGTQLDVLKKALVKYLPEGPQYYPRDMVTDHPEQFIISEVIREKVLRLTQEEVPHSVMVDIEQLERRDTSGVVYAHAIIYTERDSQKGILIGKRGAMLKKVGQMARQELEALLGNKVYLELWVKVKKDWRNDPSLLHRFGFHEER
ncbi:GTPase Era [Alicyclobacillus ferrooxydans]|uniref:GTPase Era n=1 Tax=Alicyclobacillus ferrooxydans TaxID=471514 RepID=A0A0N8PMK2_9BACL|nr:GTPase Era [Alicyclobacillus ferrooxydans]KPV38957.1 GTPase Era [Alicyclobacillus ferrooxydans]